MLWPDHLEWSTQAMRMISYASVGGGDFSEVYSVARHLPVGDNSAWYEGFSALARRVERDGDASYAGGHFISAREAWLRAAIYHRIAGQLMALAGEAHVPGVEESRHCFRNAAKLEDLPIEVVEIPFEGASLPGYLVRGGDGRRPGPAVAVTGGIDAFCEEMYLKIGKALGTRGYTVLLLDWPGQGEARRRGIYARTRFETALAAALDHLEPLPEVDPDRIALIGSSLGGFYAVRGAAYEPRIAATVVWGVSTGVSVASFDNWRDHPRFGQFMATFGATDAEDLREKLADFNLDGVPERITCPTLILHGDSDVLVPVAAAHDVFGRLRGDQHTLITYPAGEPGCTHCQLDSLPLAQRHICDWLDQQLLPRVRVRG
jgi:pimeloyl-ACP methyl ester carboxylesterase